MLPPLSPNIGAGSFSPNGLLAGVQPFVPGAAGVAPTASPNALAGLTAMLGMAGAPGASAGSPAPGAAMPPVPNYNPGGGYLHTPIGGYWNQVAQQMAGPMFAPQGASVLAGFSNDIAPTRVSQVTVPPTVGYPTPLGGWNVNVPKSGPYMFNTGNPPTSVPQPGMRRPTMPGLPAPLSATPLLGAPFTPRFF